MAVNAVVEIVDSGAVGGEWEMYRNRFVVSGALGRYENVGGNGNGCVEAGVSDGEREAKVRTCIRCREFYLARENGAGSCIWHPG